MVSKTRVQESVCDLMIALGAVGSSERRPE